MSLLSDLQTIAKSCGAPVETGVFSGKALDTYLVITPLSDNFELHADNAPGCETQEARLSLFTKGSYTKLKIHSSVPYWARTFILPTAGTSALRPRPAIITTPLTWRKSTNWRNKLWRLSVLTDCITQNHRKRRR